MVHQPSLCNSYTLIVKAHEDLNMMVVAMTMAMVQKLNQTPMDGWYVAIPKDIEQCKFSSIQSTNPECRHALQLGQGMLIRQVEKVRQAGNVFPVVRPPYVQEMIKQ